MSKVCPDCEVELGDTEQTCPKCGLDLIKVDEETLTIFERVAKIVEKRKKKAKDENDLREAEKSKVTEKEKSFFDSLRKRGM